MNYKDPYLTTQYFNPAGCFSVAQLEVNGIFRQLASPNIYYFTDFLNPAPPQKKKTPTSWHCFLGKIDPKDEEYQPVCFMLFVVFFQSNAWMDWFKVMIFVTIIPW